MTDHDALFTQMQNQGKLLEKQDEKLSRIEDAVTKIPVQEKDIIHLGAQVDALWRKYDSFLGPDGSLSAIRSHQAACPAESLRQSIVQLWTVGGIAFAALVALIGAIKIWG